MTSHLAEWHLTIGTRDLKQKKKIIKVDMGKRYMDKPTIPMFRVSSLFGT